VDYSAFNTLMARRCRREYQCDRCVGDRVESGDAEEQALHQAHQPERSQGSHNQSNGDQ
jgi:hypothetical protein